MEPEHETPADEAHRVEDAVEARDLLHGVIDVVADADEVEISPRDEQPVGEVSLDERLPVVPVRAARRLEEDDRDQV